MSPLEIDNIPRDAMLSFSYIENGLDCALTLHYALFDSTTWSITYKQGNHIRIYKSGKNPEEALTDIKAALQMTDDLSLPTLPQYVIKSFFYSNGHAHLSALKEVQKILDDTPCTPAYAIASYWYLEENFKRVTDFLKIIVGILLWTGLVGVFLNSMTMMPAVLCAALIIGSLVSLLWCMQPELLKEFDPNKLAVVQILMQEIKENNGYVEIQPPLVVIDNTPADDIQVSLQAKPIETFTHNFLG
ncbi:MAG TPA: hypothetical protein VHD33_03010 [Legionellaceae bacterium]|nr:hypothetical protein [Legionellaceae bacterium]